MGRVRDVICSYGYKYVAVQYFIRYITEIRKDQDQLNANHYYILNSCTFCLTIDNF